MRVDELANAKIYTMLPEELDNFVRNKAKPGDVAVSYNNATRRKYMYFCTKENIGKDADPVWMMIDERMIIENQLRSMTFEEKVDFLVNQYIESELCKLY